MKLIFVALGFGILIAGCNHKNKEEENNNFFPVLSFLKSQVKDIDTSVYPLMKIVTVDSVSDTSYIKREQFRAYANDFLSIPDISSKDLKDEYTETKLYDETLGRAVFTYLPKKPEAPIRREEVMIEPDNQTGGKVKSIFISRLINNKDSTVEKKMYWQVDKRFQIATIVQKPNEAEKVQVLQIIWNDFSKNE